MLRHTREPDLALAYMWFNLAVTNGHKYASGWRANLAKEMSPDQIAEAERMAAEWEPDLAECETGPGAYSGW